MAQPQIRPRDIPSQPNLILAYWAASNTVDGIEVDVGQSGENRVWDLLNYQFDDVSFDTLIDPDEAPERETFAAANRVIHSTVNDLGINLGSGYQYEVLADSGWYMLGVLGDSGILNMPMAFPNPLLILPMPAEYGDGWNIGTQYEIGFPAPDTLLGGILDSVYVRIRIGGDAEIDGWGIVRFSGGEVAAIRQRISTGGRITLVGTMVILGRRVEVELPYGFDIQTSITYRWFAAGVGEVASITSMLGEQDPAFTLARQIRVRRIIPEMIFPQATITFGEVRVGNSGLANFAFQNRGEGIGIITRVEFSGGLGSEIEVLTVLPYVVEPDSSGRLRFLWTPTVEKSLAGESALVYHNDPALNNPLTITLFGATPDFNGVNEEQPAVKDFTLFMNYPNPFNGKTMMLFELPQTSRVCVSLADVLGRNDRVLFNERRAAGRVSIPLDLSGLAAGAYLVRLETGGGVIIRKVILEK